MPSMPILVTLYLYINQIGDAGVTALAKVVVQRAAVMPSLVRLQLHHNRCGDYGATKLMDAIDESADSIEASVAATAMAEEGVREPLGGIHLFIGNNHIGEAVKEQLAARGHSRGWQISFDTAADISGYI